jgi:Zn-dependent M28 family amino/carboxypeptidase
MNKLSFLTVFSVLFILVSCKDAEQEKEVSQEWDISVEHLERHIKELSSNAFMGRMPMTVGEELTVAYLEKELKDIGVAPANNGSYLQDVSLITVNSVPDEQINVTGGKSPLTLNRGDDYVVFSQLIQDEIKVEDAEFVFCGFGIVAPEYGWNDYEGVDMTGKIAVVMVNDPGYYLKDENMFTGNAMTYYGRWTYKYEEAARQGAAGIIIIHEDAAAGYPWGVVQGSWSGSKSQLDLPQGTVKYAPLQGWITSDVAKQLFDQAGKNQEELFESAKNADFKPTPLGIKTSVTMKNTFERGTSPNVIGIIEGSTRPDEYIIYTAHWDHLGGEDPNDSSTIYNGAVDNATGTAMLLEIARAVKESDNPLERSMVFLFVTAEEQGLLGSAFYAENPVFPTNKTVANLNVDAVFPYGPTNDVLVVGHHQNDLADWAEDIVKGQGRYILPDQEAEKGFYYRSDHFNLAKVGVPAMYASGGTDLREGGKEEGKRLRTEYNQKYYHKQGDEYNPETWNMGSIAQDAEFYFRLGVKIANSQDWPKWSENSEFRAVREKDLEKK